MLYLLCSCSGSVTARHHRHAATQKERRKEIVRFVVVVVQIDPQDHFVFCQDSGLKAQKFACCNVSNSARLFVFERALALLGPVLYDYCPRFFRYVICLPITPALCALRYNNWILIDCRGLHDDSILHRELSINVQDEWDRDV